FLTIRRAPRSPLFPYTTLFRSVDEVAEQPALRPARVLDADLDLGQEVLEDRRRRDERGRTDVLQVQHHRVGAFGAVHGEAGEARSEEHTSELQSRENLVCRLLL